MKDDSKNNSDDNRFVRDIFEGLSVDSFPDILEKVNSFDGISKLLRSSSDFLSFGNAHYLKRREIVGQIYSKLENLLKTKQITSLEERDSLPNICSSLKHYALQDPDHPYDTKQIYEELQIHIGRFTSSLEQKPLLRVIGAFSNSQGYDSSEFIEILSSRFMQLAKDEAVFGKIMNRIFLNYANANHQPSAEFYEKWDEIAESLKGLQYSSKENSFSTAQAAELLHSFSLMKAEGLEVPQELAEKWFNYAANINDGTFDSRSCRQMYHAAIMFNIEKTERFQTGALNETKSNSATQADYLRCLYKNASWITNQSNSNLKITVESEKRHELLDTSVDYKIIITGGAAGANSKSIFYAQFDGPYHYRHTAKGREFKPNTKMQNQIFDKVKAGNEELVRIDYKQVKTGKDVYGHAENFLESLVEKHVKRSLNLSEDRSNDLPSL